MNAFPSLTTQLQTNNFIVRNLEKVNKQTKKTKDKIFFS